MIVFTHEVVDTLVNLHSTILYSSDTQASTTQIFLFLMACAAWVILEETKHYNSRALKWYYLTNALLLIMHALLSLASPQLQPLLVLHIESAITLLFTLCICKTFVVFYKDNKTAAFLMLPMTLLSLMGMAITLRQTFMGFIMN